MAGAVLDPPLTLAVPPHPRFGPVTRKRLRRFVGFVGAVWAAAIVVALLVDNHELIAFALGLLIPGGGFLYGVDGVAAMSVLVGATVLVTVIGLLWWGLGNIVAPPLVWVGSAALGATTADGDVRSEGIPLVIGVFAVLVMLGVGYLISDHRRTQARAHRRNAYLATISAPTATHSAAGPTELSARDLAHQRWLLEIALQPKDRFDHFDQVEQFGWPALRYQLNFCQYALAMAQRHHTPAFSGYLSRAQRNLIEKTTDRRVWRYWRNENLWGNFDRNPDPIRRDNIMFSGYLALMLALYRSGTGDTRYDEPGSLTFRWNRKRVFHYDHRSLTAVLVRQFDREPTGLFPCEPGFSYTMCNVVGADAVLATDPRLAADVVTGLQRGIDDEFTAVDGSLVTVRSSRFGFAMPGLGTGAVLGAWQRANTPLLMHPTAPLAARRCWEILRREGFRLDDDGRLTLRLRAGDRIDVGNYKGSLAHLYSWVYASAKEFGDLEVAQAALASADAELDPQFSSGARSYRNASVHSNAVFALGHFLPTGGFTDAVTLPPADPRRPVLADAPYPDCLVARAVSDGRKLELVLRPGGAGGPVALRLERLDPGVRYRLTGTVEEETTARPDGSATVHVDLRERTEVTAAPN